MTRFKYGLTTKDGVLIMKGKSKKQIEAIVKRYKEKGYKIIRIQENDKRKI
jgi:ribosomal silencing factor RsfS